MPVVKKKRKKELEQIKEEEGLDRASDAALGKTRPKITSQSTPLSPEKRIELVNKAVSQNNNLSAGLKQGLANQFNASNLEIEQAKLAEAQSQTEAEAQKLREEGKPEQLELTRTDRDTSVNIFGANPVLNKAAEFLGFGELGASAQDISSGGNKRVLEAQALGAIKNELDRQVIAKGFTGREKFNTIFEATPLFARVLRRTGVQVNIPSQKADELLVNINTLTNDAVEIANSTASVQTKTKELQRIRSDMEERTARLKLNVLNSPILQGNPEEVNTIESALIDAQQQLLDMEVFVKTGIAP